MSLLLLLIIPGSFIGHCQSALQPGFDGKEYLAMLRMAFSRQDSLSMDTATDSSMHHVSAPDNYVRHYRSPEMGLKNRWDSFLSR